jgi:repressor LexA
MARDEPGTGAGNKAGPDTSDGTRERAGEAAQVSTFPDPPTEPAGLTPRQRKVLEVIRDWVERFGYPPSVREIGDAVGLTSTSSVHHQLRALERKGYLRRDPNRTRAVDVRGPEDIAEAASGTTVEEAGAGDLRPAPAFVPLLGNIAAGGPILAEQAVESVFPLPREIVGEATVKTFKRRDGHVWLMPANPAYDPIPGDDATILGRVVAVLRRL